MHKAKEAKIKALKKNGDLFRVKIKKKDRNCFYLNCKRPIPIGMQASAFYLPGGKLMVYVCNWCRRQYHFQEPI